MKAKIESGKLNLSEIDFVPIFGAFQDIVNEENIQQSIEELGETSELFRNKIEEIQNYISQVSFDDSFKDFIKVHKNHENSENVFSAILNRCWKKSFIIEGISLNYLTNSYERWALRDYSKKKTEIIIPDEVETKGNFNLSFLEEPFLKSLERFYTYLKHKMPCTYKDIMEDSKNEEEFYDNFIYSLHLIQKHKIFYDKTTGLISHINEATKNE